MSDSEGSSSRFNYRPTSTIARSFSEQLNDAFLIGDNLEKLASTVEQKKQSVTFQSSELKLLEESLRRAEALLEEKKNRLSQQFGISPAGSDPVSPAKSRRTRPPIPTYDANGNESKAGAEPPKRAAPKPPTEGYVVVQKTASMLSAVEEKRRFEEQYKGRPPPPVPAES